jgi:hypothetical protein
MSKEFLDNAKLFGSLKIDMDLMHQGDFVLGGNARCIERNDDNDIMYVETLFLDNDDNSNAEDSNFLQDSFKLTFWGSNQMALGQMQAKT